MNSLSSLSVNQKVLIAALVGFIIGAGSVIVWNISQGPLASNIDMPEEMEEVADEMTDEMGEAEETGNGSDPIVIAEVEGYRINVTDQAAGSRVAVTGVTLERAGWVAIHEDRSGELGNILGAHWFPRGQSTGGVNLLRDTVAGNAYHAVLYNDDGDRAFELGVDARVVDENQEPIMQTFRATAL
jgi:hypothetical protein